MQIAELGHGTFGMVVKALDIRTTPHTEVAIKMLPRGDFVSPYLLGVGTRSSVCAGSSLRAQNCHATVPVPVLITLISD